MKLRIVNVKSNIWLIVVLLLAFSFPIQVVMSNPLPSLFPYVGFIFIILITTFYNNKKIYTFGNTRKINLMISVYVILVIFHATWQSVFNFITFYAAISSIVIYIFPVLFYVYFSKYASEKEIRRVLIAITISGLISGMYFVYDSYSMLILGKVNDFSYKMINYTMLRAPNNYDPNLARISAYSRSHGLLESHSISAFWISISCFSMLALLPQKEILKRSLIITIFGVFLVVTLNFTSILSFIFVVIFIEFKGYYLIKAIIEKRSLKIIAVSIITFFAVGLIFIENAGEMAGAIKKIITGQIDLLFGKTKLEVGSDETFFGNFIFSFTNFLNNMLSFPPGILIGDGFSTWGVIEKGGDYGHPETLHQLGLPFYIAVIIGLFRLIKLSLNKIQILNWKIHEEGSYLYFAACMILYILITTIHYSTWSAKSVLPIFFISIAIFSRYLPPKRKPV